MRDVAVQLERRASGTAGAAGAAPVLRSPFASGAVAAVWAVALGLVVIVVPVLLGWGFARHGHVAVSDAMRGGVLAWLAAQHATVLTTAGSLSLVPLGLLALPAVALYRCGRWAGRASVEALPAAAGATAALASSYVLAVAVVNSLTSNATVGIDVPGVVVGSLLLAVVAGGTGVISGAGLWGAVADRLAEPVPQIVRGAAAGLAVLLGGGALLLAASLLWHFDRVLTLTRSLQAGASGGLVLLTLGVLSVPTGIVWAAAYAVGPGFSVGVGTAVAPAGIALGPVPAYPLLGGLPSTGPAPSASLAALAVPLVAGIVVGILAARRPAATTGRTVAEAAAAGAAAGLALGVLAWLASGSLGAVRMSELGPDGLRVGLVAALEVGAVAAASAWEFDRHADGFAHAAATVRRLADIVRHRGRPSVAGTPAGRPRLRRRKQPASPARRVD